MFNEKISNHQHKDSNGYLICKSCIIATTGKYALNTSISDESNPKMEVDIPCTDIMNPDTMASLENAPITLESVFSDNTRGNNLPSIGYICHIYGDSTENGLCLVGTAVITDFETIKKIESGALTILSYEFDCIGGDSHKFNIRENHITLCECSEYSLSDEEIPLADHDLCLPIGQAIDVCINLGKKFIRNFHRIYVDSSNQAVDQWCKEMNHWLSKALKLRLRPSNETLTETKLRDWFFTAGAYIDEYIQGCSLNEERTYDKFIRLTIDYGDTIKAVSELFK